MVQSENDATLIRAGQDGAHIGRHAALRGPVFAIESSCDETACAVLSPDGRILAEKLVSQEGHKAFGGVVPEIAARAHLALLPDLASKTLAAAGLGVGDLGAVAASTGPGLIGGLIVGTNFGKGLALAAGCPFIAVNHIEAHALSPRLPGVSPSTPDFPYLLLLVSGGHCQCLAVRGVGQYQRLGGTIDDSAGEAFDKVAKMLGLGWPGGPALEALAREGNPQAVSLPRPLRGRAGCDFSFSGLKTAVARQLEMTGEGGPAQPLSRARAADLAAGFQCAVTDVIADRVENALGMMEKPVALVVAGGVAANQMLRARLMDIAESAGIAFAAPPLRLCTDNAVMVGWAALEVIHEAERLGMELPDDQAMRPRPRWPLEEMALRGVHDMPPG
ncbi:MAG: tRNA (adenosine(37)-N6)-threonylcarbamoyltransferase complex transferase subunit TsaD [Acetobacter sp.]|jgi:N6-L-threonylcarbamoyladenine synthase